jgi:DNA (cytosine-5)-methyltransferase 1
MSIPVIDLFAGPGGLAEGFSMVKDGNDYFFDIKLSIEKDPEAHKTLKLRSFFRQFIKRHENLPEDYYEVLREKNLKDREKKLTKLFELYPKYHEAADKEARNIELGSPEFTNEYIDELISEAIGEDNKDKWVLIGGPPCQAYSIAGRSRTGGINSEDHRVYLYKEYLRIIAKHHPAVFVMENVKGLLSAKVNGKGIFEWIKKDLSDPGSIFPFLNAPEYNIYSLVKEEVNTDSDYLIKSELYGIPQKRHRVILLGVRKDVNEIAGRPETLKKRPQIPLKEVISGLPRIRSSINRKFLDYEFKNGKQKRHYQNLNDSDSLWEKTISQFKDEILSWEGIKLPIDQRDIIAPAEQTGSEFIQGADNHMTNEELRDWLIDSRLGGFPNHESRTHLLEDLKRYLFSSIYSSIYIRFPRLKDYKIHSESLIPDHKNAMSGKFVDRFRVQLPESPATTITSHISKDGHYFIHYDYSQCRSFTVREAARVQTFPDNYLFCGTRTHQYIQVGNAVPPLLSFKIGEIVKNISALLENNN